MSVKERAIRAIQELPDDAGYEAVSEKLDFMRAVDEGLAQAKTGKTLSADEVRKRLSKWLSRVDFTEIAADDLESISNFIGADNPEAASRVCRGLYETALSLGAHPFLGRVTPEYCDPNIRDIVRGNYRIVYLVHEDRELIEILKFWHGARGYLQ